MEISQFILAQLWLCAFILGAGLGAVYDVFSITRVFLGVPFTSMSEKIILLSKTPVLKRREFTDRPRLRSIVCFFEDILFFFIATVSLILLFYRFNEGNIRIPVIGFALIGFWGYRAIFGRLFHSLLEIFLLSVINLIAYIGYYLLLPVRILFLRISAMLKRIYRKGIRYWERKQRIRHTNFEERRLLDSACGML